MKEIGEVVLWKFLALGFNPHPPWEADERERLIAPHQSYFNRPFQSTSALGGG